MKVCVELEQAGWGGEMILGYYVIDKQLGKLKEECIKWQGLWYYMA